MKNNYFKGFALGAFLLSASGLFCQTPQQITQITEEYNQQRLVQLEQQFSQKQLEEKAFAEQQATALGIETKLTLEDGGFAELQRVLPDGTLIYYRTYNVDAALSTRTNHLNSGGSLGLNLMGQNLTAHVWDGGHGRVSHQEYDGAGGNNRFSVGDGTSTLNFHAAHVTGTIIASGVQADAKGMAPHAEAIGYDWNNDTAEATATFTEASKASLSNSIAPNAEQLPRST